MSLEDKQNLLVQEILNKGFDPHVFQNQLDMSDQSKQLEDWTFEELKEAVRKFQDQQTDYYQVFPCPQTPRSIYNPQATITGYEKVVRGLFQNLHIYFQIQGEGFQAKRHYEEFQQLRGALARCFYVPEIPNQKKTVANEFSYIKQSNYLQSFLNFICDDPELFNLQIVQDFLIGSQELKYPPVPYSSLSGNYGLRINRAMEEFIRSQEGSIQASQPHTKKAYKLLRSFMKQISQLSMTMQQLSEQYQRIYQQNKEPIFVVLSHLFQQWNKIQQDHAKIINETLYSSQRFQYYLINPLKDCIRLRDQEQKSFRENASKLQTKKEKLFQQGDVLRWDLDESYLDHYKIDQIKSNFQVAQLAMCKQETLQLRNVKNQFATINLRTYEQINQVLQHGRKQLVNTCVKMSRMMALSLSQYHTLWADTLTNLNELKN